MSAPGTGTIAPLPMAMQSAMRGVTWHDDLPCPPLEELRLLELPFINFSGSHEIGRLVTSAQLAPEVVVIFARLWALAFPIASIRPMTEFAGDDDLSMAANNSSCFNARRIMGSTRLSMHSYGAAIDINPVQNPVIRDGIVRPAQGSRYLDRSVQEPGMIIEGSAALQVFLDAGWSWGGYWQTPLDYHHFYRADTPS